MKVAIDTSPLKSAHKFRGVGFYTKRLVESLQEIDEKNEYLLTAHNSLLTTQADIIHYPYFDLFWLTLPLKKPKPTVVTVHDLTPLVFPNKFPKGIKGSVKYQIQRRSLRGAKAIIADSKNSKKDIIRFIGFPKDRIYVIYLAPGEEFKKLEMPAARDSFEMGNWKLEIKEKYQLPETFLLYVGDINYNKNIPGLVRACEKVKLPLAIVGKQAVEKNIDRSHPENRDLVWLQDYCKSSIINHQSSIILTGFVPDKDLVAIYNLATVYCQPSFYEGFGLPVLEAMACGTPVVAANTSSLPEICGDATIMIDPYKIENIARGIKKVISDKTIRDRLVEKGLAQAKKFSWEKTARETIKVYEKVYEG